MRIIKMRYQDNKWHNFECSAEWHVLTEGETDEETVLQHREKQPDRVRHTQRDELMECKKKRQRSDAMIFSTLW